MIPPRIKQGIDFYAEHGYEPGGFLRSCLHNDLHQAICCADEDSLAELGEIVRYIVNRVPWNAWGDCERVDAWIKAKAAQRKIIPI